jgi:hypothetical protein
MSFRSGKATTARTEHGSEVGQSTIGLEIQKAEGEGRTMEERATHESDGQGDPVSEDPKEDVSGSKQEPD